MADLTKIQNSQKVSAFHNEDNLVADIVDVEEGSGSDLKEMKTFDDTPCCTASECCRSSSFCKNHCKSSLWCAYCIGLRNLSWVTKSFIVLFLAVSVITLEFAADTSFCYFNPVVPMAITPMSTPRDESTRNKRFSLTLFGDSMIKDAADKFQFVDKIIQFLPHYNFNISVHADNAVRIKNVRERFLRILKDENPDGFIFMIDSDITDVPNAFLSQKRQYELLSNYSKNFEFVIQTLQKRNKWVAVASPCGVLMESKYFSPPKSSRFHDKENTLVQYTKATELVAIKTAVPYIDIRTPTLAAIPHYRVGYKGCVTRDGEHANDYGTIIMANKFAAVINDWFSSVTSPRVTKDGTGRQSDYS